MAKDTYYFSHDYNARTDEKIKLLIRKHGLRGYGIFWAIVEDLYNNANALRLDCEGIAFELREDSETIKSVIHDFNLFKIDGDIFGSLSVQDRLNQRLGKSATARESALKRWNKTETDANAMQTQCECNAIKERKGKEKKGKEIKEEDAPPTLLDFKKYCVERGYHENIGETAFYYYQNMNWIDKEGNAVKNWKNKLNNVWFKEDNKIQKGSKKIAL